MRLVGLVGLSNTCAARWLVGPCKTGEACWADEDCKIVVGLIGSEAIFEMPWLVKFVEYVGLVVGPVVLVGAL